MSSNIDLTLKDMKAFEQKLRRASKKGVSGLIHYSEEDILQTYMQNVKSVTPVKSGKLRDGWHIGRSKVRWGSEPKYRSAVLNNVEYAKYVEYGRHQKKTRATITPGKNMRRQARSKTEAQIAGIIDAQLKKFEEGMK